MDAIQEALRRDKRNEATAERDARIEGTLQRLTAREREVMLLVVSGMLTKQIASRPWAPPKSRRRSIAAK